MAVFQLWVSRVFGGLDGIFEKGDFWLILGFRGIRFFKSWQLLKFWERNFGVWPRNLAGFLLLVIKNYKPC